MQWGSGGVCRRAAQLAQWLSRALSPRDTVPALRSLAHRIALYLGPDYLLADCLSVFHSWSARRGWLHHVSRDYVRGVFARYAFVHILFVYLKVLV